MKIIRRKTMLLASLALVFSQTAFSAEKKAKPELMTGASPQMMANTCAGCHGTDGSSQGPSIPNIAGFSSAYFIEVMEGYKSGDVPSTIMGRLAKGYSSVEIAQMGEYFAKQKSISASGQAADAGKAEKGAELHEKYCEKCHTESGTVADDDSGFLKGQWKSYLTAQMMDYQSDSRKATKKMKKQLKKMHKKHGVEGMEALVEYYSK